MRIPATIVIAAVSLAACRPATSSPMAPTQPSPSAASPSAASPSQPRGELLCGDVPHPPRSGHKPDGASIVRTVVAHTAQGTLLVGVESFASFALPSKTATTSSSHTNAYVTWGFLEGTPGHDFTPIGALGQTRGSGSSGQVIEGRGSIALAAHDGAFAVCDPGTRRPLPPRSAVGDQVFVAAEVDGNHLYTLHAHVGRSRRCTGLAAGTIAIQTYVLARVALGEPDARWETIRTDRVATPPGEGCRSRIALAGSVGTSGAAVAVASCSHQDAGDSISIDDCRLSAHVLRADQALEEFALPGGEDGFPPAAVSLQDGVPRVAVGDEQSRVFRLVGGRTIAEGTRIPGTVVALEGTRLVASTPDGAPGPAGFGFRYVAQELRNGTWVPTTGPIDATGRGASFAWEGDVVVAALPEDESTRVRVVRSQAKTWTTIATLDAYVTP